MTTTSHTLDLQPVSKDSLKSVCASPGPFVTVLLPPCHPGAADLPGSERWRDLIRAAEHDFTSRHYSGPIRPLLDPLQELASHSFSRAQTEASILFSSPSGAWRFRLPSLAQQRLIVATHPYILPLVSAMGMESDYYLLALSKNLLRLARCREGRCSEVPLPSHVPCRLEQFGDFDKPDHDLENRSSAGSSAVQAPGVRFGTSADREQSHLYDYYRLVDRELRPILGGLPLVLLGVSYELAAYRHVAKYPVLLEAKPGSPEHVPWPDLADHARPAIRERYTLDTKHAVAQFRETRHRGQVVSGVPAVLQAAREGRVHKLLLERDTECLDGLEPLYPPSPERLGGVQDLINAAAVETIRTGGEVQTLEPLQLGEASPLAAILRYSPA